MAMKKAKKPMRGYGDEQKKMDEFKRMQRVLNSARSRREDKEENRTMETRNPNKRYPAFNVQPQRPQRPGNKPVEMPKKRKKAAAPKRAAVKRSYR